MQTREKLQLASLVSEDFCSLKKVSKSLDESVANINLSDEEPGPR